MYRRRYLRRTGRRYGRTFKRKTFRRVKMYRRMFKKTGKPEIKWLNLNASMVTAVSGVNTNKVTPTTIPPGSGQSERIGNKIKTLSLSVYFEVNSDTVGTYALPVSKVRVILWSPKLSDGPVTVQIQTYNNADFVDPNIAHVHLDTNFNIYQINQGSATFDPTSGESYTKRFRKFIRFPRTIDFINGNNNILDFKDMIFLTVFVYSSGGPQVITQWRTRLRYVDM